jgi:hypothetical protein
MATTRQVATISLTRKQGKAPTGVVSIAVNHVALRGQWSRPTGGRWTPHATTRMVEVSLPGRVDGVVVFGLDRLRSWRPRQVSPIRDDREARGLGATAGPPDPPRWAEITTATIGQKRLKQRGSSRWVSACLGSGPNFESAGGGSTPPGAITRNPCSEHTVGQHRSDGRSRRA